MTFINKPEKFKIIFRNLNDFKCFYDAMLKKKERVYGWVTMDDVDVVINENSISVSYQDIDFDDLVQMEGSTEYGWSISNFRTKIDAIVDWKNNSAAFILPTPQHIKWYKPEDEIVKISKKEYDKLLRVQKKYENIMIYLYNLKRGDK